MVSIEMQTGMERERRFTLCSFQRSFPQEPYIHEGVDVGNNLDNVLYEISNGDPSMPEIMGVHMMRHAGLGFLGSAGDALSHLVCSPVLHGRIDASAASAAVCGEFICCTQHYLLAG